MVRPHRECDVGSVALIYVRKSIVRYDADRASPERQIANCIKICEQKGWRYEIYEDAEGHRSGRSEKHRPAWRRLKHQLARREVAAVVVNSLDRASRSPKDFFNFLDLLQEHDVELISVHEQFDTTTAIGKAFLAILMVVASLESDLASERILDSIDHRRRRGVHVGIPPFGYDRVEGKLAPNEDAANVRLAMELYATGDYSYPQLARELNRRGYRFRDRYGAKRFTAVSIRSILENAWLYAGRLPVGRERGHGYEQIYDGKHKPIITRALAKDVVEARQQRYRGTGRGMARVFLLSGILYCHECGDRLWGSRRDDRSLIYYRHSKRTCLPGQGSFDALDVEAQALELLDGVKIPPELQDMIRARAQNKLEQRPDNQHVAKALSRERAKLTRLKEMRLEGEVDRDEYRSRKAEITDIIKDLETQLGSPEYDAGAALRHMENIAEVIREGDPSQQKRALATMFERIEVSATHHKLARVVPRRWFGLFFEDLTSLVEVERAWRGLDTLSSHKLRSLIA